MLCYKTQLNKKEPTAAYDMQHMIKEKIIDNLDIGNTTKFNK